MRNLSRPPLAFWISSANPSSTIFVKGCDRGAHDDMVKTVSALAGPARHETARKAKAPQRSETMIRASEVAGSGRSLATWVKARPRWHDGARRRNVTAGAKNSACGTIETNFRPILRHIGKRSPVMVMTENRLR